MERMDLFCKLFADRVRGRMGTHAAYAMPAGVLQWNLDVR